MIIYILVFGVWCINILLKWEKWYLIKFLDKSWVSVWLYWIIWKCLICKINYMVCKLIEVGKINNIKIWDFRVVFYFILFIKGYLCIMFWMLKYKLLFEIIFVLNIIIVRVFFGNLFCLSLWRLINWDGFYINYVY